MWICGCGYACIFFIIWEKSADRDALASCVFQNLTGTNTS